MAMKAAKGPAEGREPAPQRKPNSKPDIIQGLRQQKGRLELHLTDETVIKGEINLTDQYNLLFKSDDSRLFWVPKHAVVYAELL